MPLRQLHALPERLETERLHLRPYRESDAAWYCAMALGNREHLLRHEPANPLHTIQCESDAAQLLRLYARRWCTREAFPFGIFLRGTEEFAGQIYLGTTDSALPSFNLGFFADYAHVNRGYVTEAARQAVAFAFGDLGAHRVGLWCDDTNLPSRRIAERCGFRLEGHVREDKRHPDETISGSLCFGLLGSEYRANAHSPWKEM